MLVLGGVEITFFKVWVCVWICAENNVDITQMFLILLSSIYSVKAFLLLIQPDLQGGWGLSRSWEGTQLTPNTSGITQTIQCHAQHIKVGEGGDIWNDSICLPKTPFAMMGPVPWRCLNTCLSIGSSEDNS